VSPGGGGAPATITTSVVGTVDVAAAQASQLGQEIHRLTIFDGKLYDACGDYGANTGPIDVVSLDLATQEFGSNEATLHTEETFTMRVLDGALHVPYCDPQGSNDDPSQGQLAVTSGGGSWGVVTSCTGVTHAFDVAKTADGLFLFGSNETGDQAVIWRSTDDGATWTESLTVDAPEGATPLFARFYAAAQIGDDLTAFYHDDTVDAAYHWNGSTWDETATPARSVCGTPAAFTHDGTPFVLGLATAVDTGQSSPSTPTAIVTPSDAAQQATIQATLPDDVKDAAATDSYLYALCVLPVDDAYLITVHRGDTAGSWSVLGALDDNTACCIAVDPDGGYLYFGTTDSRIIRTPIPS
jgi:hypothetical protein